MENANRWYFTKEQLENSPTRKCGIDASKELSYRQQGANFIQDMGQRLHVTQLCINTAIVYMHRFYVFHAFQRLHKNEKQEKNEKENFNVVIHAVTKQCQINFQQLAVAALFLAAKVEEQPRKLEHVVRVAYKCLNRGEDLDPKSDDFLSKCGDLVFHENMMLQTLGFDIAIDHPHTYVVKLLQLVKDSAAQKDVRKGCAKLALIPVNGRSRASGGPIEIGAETVSSATKDLAQTSYFMATNSLHLTTMCLQYRPTVVACVCIHLACKWSDWKIEPCSEGKEWYYYVDKSVTPELLEELTKDFLAVLEKSPNRLKRRSGPEMKDPQSQFKPGDEIITRMDSLTYDNCIDPPKGNLSPSLSSLSSVMVKQEKLETEKNEASAIPESSQYSSPAKKTKTEPSHSISLAVYREKKEKERLSDVKPPLPAPIELPLPPIARSLPLTTSSREKRPVSTETLSNELVPQKMLDVKNITKHLHSSSKLDSTSSAKVNHHISKTPVVPPNPPAPRSSSGSSKNDVSRMISGNIKTNDPFVLLTRLDQTHMAKKVGESKTMHHAQMAKVNLKPSSPRDVKVLDSRALAHPKPPLDICDTKSVAKLSELQPTTSSRPKHSKQKTPVQNSHIDAQLSSQGILQKPSHTSDLGKTNGSSVQSAVDGRMSLPPMEIPKALEKNIEVQVKQEKRERHRHKHSVHSSRDKVSNHVTDSPSDSNLSGSIKITIPKDKIVLSGVHTDQKSNASRDNKDSLRTSLKIKIAKPKPPPPELPVVKTNPSSTGLKLVITKDKNAGSYSAMRKAEKASRKRDRSPSSKEHNSRSTKQHKGDHGNQIDRIPANEVETRNCVTWNASANADGIYHQNNIGQQGYAAPPPYNQPLYYQQPYYNYPMHGANMQYGHVPPPLPPAPPTSNSAPPLPRGPPPPLPPQPPLPSE